METRTDLLPVEEALASIRRVLDHVDPDRTRLAPEVRLRVATTARTLTGRLDALASVLLGEAERARASERATRTPLSSQLAMDLNLTRREAAALTHQAAELVAHPVLGDAAVAGTVSTRQARAIGKAINDYSPQLSPTQQASFETRMVDLARTLDSDALVKAAPKVVAELTPAEAARTVETRLQQEAETAYRQRSVRFWRQAGSVRFEGLLPRLAGEQFIALIDAHLEARRRTAIETRDPRYTEDTPEQRRADALAALLRAAAGPKPEPGVGTARVIVKLDYDQLLAGAAGAGVIGDGQPLSAGELRRICCEADLIPAVLRGGSEVLDVGHKHRLVTKPIRTALTVRDGGCAFPTCTAPDNNCDAHHIVPWWEGGPTRLSNLVLLCHHHHATIEPAKYPTAEKWQVRIGADQLPEFLPPGRHPQAGEWLRHNRHRPLPPAPAAGETSGPPELAEASSDASASSAAGVSSDASASSAAGVSSDADARSAAGDGAMSSPQQAAPVAWQGDEVSILPEPAVSGTAQSALFEPDAPPGRTAA